MKSFYNKLVLFLLVSIALVACGKQYEVEAALGGGTNVHNHSSATAGGGTLNLSGTLSSSRVCASGYTRITPTYCKHNSSGFVLVGTVNAACTQTSALPGVSGARAVSGRILVRVISINAAGLRTREVGIYGTDSGCVGRQDYLYVRTYEQIATVATVLSQTPVSFVSTSNTAGQIYVRDITNPSADDILVTGYFD